MLHRFQMTASADKGGPPDRRQNCQHFGEPCLLGEAICARLCAAVAMARPLLAPDFELRGEIATTACRRPCRLAFRSTVTATWCFGDVPDGADLDRLMAGTVAHPGAAVVAVHSHSPLQ